MLKKEVSNLVSTTFKLPEHTQQLNKSLSESYGSQGTVIVVAADVLNLALHQELRPPLNPPSRKAKSDKP